MLKMPAVLLCVMISLGASAFVSDTFASVSPASPTPIFHLFQAPSLGYVSTQVALVDGRLYQPLNGSGLQNSPPVSGAQQSSPNPALPFQYSSSFGKNVQVSIAEPGPAPFENEPTIAASPLNDSILVEASHDYNAGPLPLVVTYYSTDGGSTWVGPNIQAPDPGSDFESDPALASDRNGVFYLSYLSLNSTTGVDNITISKSADDGRSWSTSTVISGGTCTIFNVTCTLLDKDYLAVGPDPVHPSSDDLYLTFTNFSVSVSEVNTSVEVMRSTDGGADWSGPVVVQSGTGGYAVQGAYPAVGPDGTVYVSFWGLLPHEGSPTSAVFVSRSRDGGSTFSAPVLAAQTNGIFGSSGPYGFRSNPFPSIAVGPSGQVYVAYSSPPENITTTNTALGIFFGVLGIDYGDVYVTRSTDGGATWGSPIDITSGETNGTGQFMPWISVRQSDGSVHVAWVDQSLSRDGLGYDIFYANSTDGGSTFSQPTRVTDYTSSLVASPYFTSLFFIGDYINMVVTQSQVHIVWTDTRQGQRTGVSVVGTHEDIYTADIGSRSASATIDTQSVMAGYSAQTVLSVTGLSPFSRYSVWLGGSILVSDIQADSAGTLVVGLNIPPLQPGNYTVEVGDATSGALEASQQLAVSRSDIITQLESIMSLLGGSTGNLTGTVENLSLSLSSLSSQLVSDNALLEGILFLLLALFVVVVILLILLIRLSRVIVKSTAQPVPAERHAGLPAGQQDRPKE
jgi:hypothetical protein